MAKAAITKKYSLSAQGILVVDDECMGIENPDSGEFIELSKLLADFADKSIKLSVTYDYDYNTEAEAE